MSVEVPLLVEYLTTTQIGEKGQLTVPKEYRIALGLETGAPMAVLRIGDGLVLLPEQARFQSLCESIRSALQKGGVSPEAVQSTLPQSRERVFNRRYPNLAAKKTGRRGNKAE